MVALFGDIGFNFAGVLFRVMRVDKVTFVRLESGDDFEHPDVPERFDEADLESIKAGDTVVFPQEGVVVRWRGADRVWIK